MLKNVAIPLMLAATQAEALDAADILEAMEADEEAAWAGFIADAPACTAASNTNISNLAGLRSSAEAAVTGAKKAVTDIQTTGGAWFTANAAREAAVTAAVTSEAASNIAGLLDSLDSAADAERAAAKAWLAADKAYQAQIVARDAAQLRVNQTLAKAVSAPAGTADCAAGFTSTYCTLKKASDAAAQAVTDAKAQHSKETLWREWLYCELGAVPAGSTSGLSGWWKASATLQSSASEPASCTVP